MAEGDTFVNAVIGAVVTFVVGSVAPPVGPLVGGIVAGYLEGGDRSDGVRVGAYAGLLGLVPLVALVLLIGAFLSAIGIGMGFGVHAGPWSLIAGGFGLVALIALLFFAAYVVALGAVGGWVGNYLKYEADL